MKLRSPPPSELAPGGFAYRVGDVLGEGATATAHRAWTPSGAGVVLKVGHSLAERGRLASEAELLALVESSGLAPLVDAGVVPPGHGALSDRPYLAVEWSEEVAADRLHPRAEDRAALALAVARDVGDALATLHALGLAHGDVKPANVVVSQAGGVLAARLIDLGLQGAAAEAVPAGGTRRYLAPEVLVPGAPSDARTRDLWALGVTLAELGSQAAADLEPGSDAMLEALAPELRRVVSDLLSRAPGRRPSADWVSAQAREALIAAGAPDSARSADATAPARPADAERRVRRAYVAVRRAELVAASRSEAARVTVEGVAGQWLDAKLRLLARVAALRGLAPRSAAVVLADLDGLGKARFLTLLAGGAASRWPLPADLTDAVLVTRVLAFAARRDPGGLTLADLLPGAPSGDDAGSTDLPQDPVDLALALGAGAPAAPLLAHAERWVEARGGAAALRLALGRALRLVGSPGRALAVLEAVDSAEARAEAAECARRAGDVERARALAEGASGTTAFPVRARALATLARLLLDGGDGAAALALLSGLPGHPATLEVRALAEAARGDLDAARALALQGRALARTDEERARLDGVLGTVAHALGDPRRALEAFLSAAEHAVRAGAVLEEATYLTGVAAAGFDAGQLAEALAAAARATVLFEHLGRPREAARALLSRAATYAAGGATVLARGAADLAIERARLAGDRRARAFAHLVHADVRADDDPEGLEHARRAAALLEHPDATERDRGAPGDRLHAAARLLRRGEPASLEVLDALADAPGTPVPARLDWWGARAHVLARGSTPGRADRVLSALFALAAVPGPVPGRGEAFAAAAALSARASDGEAVRRFSLLATEAARTLAQGAPPELRVGVQQLPWVRDLRAPRESELSREHLADVETLVRALGARDRLRPLLDQVLDALVLWTGVERGLLLLRAPGGKLVPRAARNLARADLHGLQLSLSRSLAERALATAEPVVAVDAAGELPEVHQSVHALKLRSVLAVPLVARGEALGVAYLDDRVRRGAFGPGELAWVRLVSALAAVAIADARDQLALRRAARRARRAEARLERALARRTAELDAAARELARTRGDRGARYPYEAIIGESPKIRALLALVDRVTDSDVPVLIAGESGSGKELVARAIHDNGPRRGGPFVSENCGAIPETLLESALFGHVRGAFTGASRTRAGLFEVASGGTLFLDEIGEMSPGMQTKFLRILEDGEVRPVGSERARKVNVRVIAASHRDLATMVAAGKFRQDLYYRLNVILIEVPPLRERPGDVELLARHFVQKHGGGRDVRLSRAAVEALAAYSWPGNVRQLENEVRRAIVLGGETLSVEHLSTDVQRSAEAEAARSDGLNVRRRVDALEAELVRTALERTRGNQTRAAELLGLSRFGLQKMIRRLDISVPGADAGRDEPRAVTGAR